MDLSIKNFAIAEMQSKGIEKEILERLQQLEVQLVEFVEYAVKAGLPEEFKGVEKLVLVSLAKPFRATPDELPLLSGKPVTGSKQYPQFQKNLSEYRRLKKRIFKKLRGDSEKTTEAPEEESDEIAVCPICEEPMEDGELEVHEECARDSEKEEIEEDESEGEEAA